MNKLLSFAVIMLALSLVATAQAEKVNATVGGEIRNRLYWQENFTDLSDATDDGVGRVETRAIFDLNFLLADNVDFLIAGEGIGNWGDRDGLFTTTGSNGDGDIITAVVRFNEIRASAWSLDLGRQHVGLGTGFLLSDAERELYYDGVLATGDYAPYAITAGWLKLDETLTMQQDVDLFVADLNYEEDSYVLGGYAIVIRDDSTANYQPWVIGARGAYAADMNLNLWGEFAYQGGDSGTLDKEAWGLDLGASYAIDANWEPTVSLAYTVGTGDNNAADADDKAFDPLGQYNYYGQALAPSLTNIEIINASIGITPDEFWNLTLDYFFYTQNKTAAQVMGSTLLTDPGIQVATNGADDSIGQEVDLTVSYKYTDGVTTELSLAYFLPGNAYDLDDNALEVKGEIKVSF